MYGHIFAVLNFLRREFRLQSLGDRIYVTVELVTMFTEDYCIWDSEYVENNRLRELQPPQLRTVCYVMFESMLHVLYDSTLLSFFSSFFLSSLIFLSWFFFLCCLLMITRFQLYQPFVLTNFLFSSQNFSYGYFSTFQTYVLSHFFFFLNSINLSFTWALSIQFSSYFVINNAMLFDFFLTFKTRTIVSNVRTYSIYICINLTIVVIFIHNIFIFVFI